MALSVDAKTLYDAGDGLDWDIALGIKSQIWTSSDRRGAVLRSNDVPYVDMQFVPGKEEYGYMLR